MNSFSATGWTKVCSSRSRPSLDGAPKTKLWRVRLRVGFRSCVSALVALLTTSLLPAETRLTEDGSLKRDPVFITGGSHVVYGVDEGTDLIRLLKMDLETRETKPLHADATKTEFEVSFSADGRYHTFVQNTGNLTLVMLIRDAMENKEAKISHQGRGGYCRPVVAPDASRVIYCFAEKGPQQIWSVNVNGEDKKQLTDSQGVSNWPSYSADSKTIVFTSQRTGTYELFVMNADGSDQRQITDNQQMELRPRISPDGKQICYVTNADASREVFVMNVDGTNVRRVTDHPELDDYPAWHPSGKQLIYVSERLGNFDLYLTDVPQ